MTGKSVHSRGLFSDSELTPGEFLIVFVLYADTPLTINQVAFLLSPSYKMLYDRIKETEIAFIGSFPTLRERISQRVGGQTQVDETYQVSSSSKAKSRRSRQ